MSTPNVLLVRFSSLGDVLLITPLTYDNIPVLSYLVLRGKCRACGRKISPEYPVVEALTAAGFVLVHIIVEPAPGLAFVAGCVFTSALVALGFIDYHHQILPEAITLPGLVLALVYAFSRGAPAFREALSEPSPGPDSSWRSTLPTSSSARRKASAWAT